MMSPTKKVTSIDQNVAVDFTFKLMAIALQHTSHMLALDVEAFVEPSLDELLDELEQSHGLSTGRGESIARLRSLLQQFHRSRVFVREANSPALDRTANRRVLHAIHSAIASLCSRERFGHAVESTSQRAIYQFAYGLSHEINNPLANISARAQQLIPNVASEADRRSLATIVDQTMRAHEMLSEMMRVVQPRPVSLRKDDVVAIVREAVEAQNADWKHTKIQVEFRLSPKPLYGEVERASLSEAISSIVQNAMQVCRPSDCIEIICQEVGGNQPDFGPSCSSGLQATPVDGTNRIRIAIRDTGPGLSAETAVRAWDLYFSGREHGRGLGISLANVRRILDAHRGLVWLNSAPNAGCTIEIRLPASPAPSVARRTLSI
ncbi:MAG: HAMP domain-containing sensor histidine kinase [Pirellula sp.]